jgi:hypothetical protein
MSTSNELSAPSPTRTSASASPEGSPSQLNNIAALSALTVREYKDLMDSIQEHTPTPSPPAPSPSGTQFVLNIEQAEQQDKFSHLLCAARIAGNTFSLHM